MEVVQFVVVEDLRGEGGEAGQELVLYVVCVDGCFDGGGGGVVVIGEEAR